MLFNTSKIEKRILEIQDTLSDEARIKKMAVGIPMNVLEGRLKKANKPLLSELKELKTKRQFIHDNRQLTVNILSIMMALFIAFIVPYWQNYRKEQSDIQSIYQTIIANQDIFITNSGDFKNSQKTGVIVGFPQTYIQYNLDENTLKTIQKHLGIVQYQFFLYYLNQTSLLNDALHQFRNNFIYTGSKSLKVIDSDHVYTSTMEYLSSEGDDTNFVYIDDTECLIYMFQKSFSNIQVSKREKGLSCSNSSLNRLFYYFGYIPVDTPKWLVPQLRTALNSKEVGLGERLIQD